MSGKTPTEANLQEAQQLLNGIREMAIKAEAEQWNPPSVKLKKGSGPSRSGEHSDPTGDLASSPERLELRKAVQLTEHNSRALLIATRLMSTRLKKALKPYGGI